MSQIRKAHSNEIIDRRLQQYEMADAIDLMELVGLHDEMARVERKWLEKAERQRAGDGGTRPLANAEEHNSRFERLTKLVEATLRRNTGDSPERQYLQRVGEQLRARKPVRF